MHEIIERTTQAADVVGDPRRGRRGDPRDAARRAVGADCAARCRRYAIRLTLAIASRFAVRDAARQAVRAVRRQPARGAGARARRQDSRAPTRARRSCRSTTSAPHALPALRHRVLLNFEGEAEQVNPDTIVKELLAGVASRLDRQQHCMHDCTHCASKTTSSRSWSTSTSSRSARSPGRTGRTGSRASAGAGSSSPTIAGTRPATISATSTGRPTSG